jgi:arginine-tRNA-protein transferase
VNDQTVNFPRFFISSPTPCPYLPGRLERKIYTDLSRTDAPALNDALSQAGFRRSQNVAYRPACEGCAACISVRVQVSNFSANKTMRRVQSLNGDLTAVRQPASVTEEQYNLLQHYLEGRHPEGGMAEMRIGDYAEMVESSPVNTFLIEYRLPPRGQEAAGELIAVALSDLMADGLSMVYSFFNPRLTRRSLGTFMVLQHIDMARKLTRPHVYLGYYVASSPKMNYKAKFQPLEQLNADGWQLYHPSP